MNIESVWDYPRPPRLEVAPQHIRVVHRGVTVADTHAALRILETSHPPVFYIPSDCLAPGLLRRSASRQSFCEFKGLAGYWDLVAGGVTVLDTAWSYAQPTAASAAHGRPAPLQSQSSSKSTPNSHQKSESRTPAAASPE